MYFGCGASARPFAAQDSMLDRARAGRHSRCAEPSPFGTQTREEFRERVKREVPKIKEDEELQEDASDSDESDNSADAELAAMFARMPARQTKPKPSKV